MPNPSQKPKNTHLREVPSPTDWPDPIRTAGPGVASALTTVESAAPARDGSHMASSPTSAQDSPAPPSKKSQGPRSPKGASQAPLPATSPATSQADGPADDAQEQEYYTFEVFFPDEEDFLMREFMLPASATFYDLHLAIQIACGWEGLHTADFRRDEDDLRPFVELQPESPKGKSFEKMRLNEFFGGGVKTCLYVYDYDDFWVHVVNLTGTSRLSQRFKRRLLSGRGNFPPENSGDFDWETAFSAFEKELNDEPFSPEEEEVLGYLGDWRPEPFDFEGTKRRFDR